MSGFSMIFKYWRNLFVSKPLTKEVKVISPIRKKTPSYRNLSSKKVSENKIRHITKAGTPFILDHIRSINYFIVHP